MTHHHPAPGSIVFVPDALDVFVRASVDHYDNNDVVVIVSATNAPAVVAPDDLIEAGRDVGDLADVDDLAQLDRITVASLLTTLRTRWRRDRIYTFAGPTLVAINPFRHITDLYTRRCILDVIQRSTDGDEPIPHIYSVADQCRRRLLATKGSQSLIIVGDSGSGKTEAAKVALQFLAEVSPSGEPHHSRTRPATNQIQDRIIQCNPVLEAFGNAQTTRNENSSRFGKYLEMSLGALSGSIRGASMTYFMLETSRVVSHCSGERSFHAFYALLIGLSSSDLAQRLGLVPDKTYYAMLVAKGVGDPIESPSGRRPSIPSLKVHSPAEEWAAITAAMGLVGLLDVEISAVAAVLASILHLSNITFVGDDDGHATIAGDQDHLLWFLRLTCFDPDQCRQALVSRLIGHEAHRVHVPITAENASSTRNALAKEMYSRLFRWLVARMNVALEPEHPHDDDDDVATIGILDVFGFERFDDRNGFEQICINYCNERLQTMFVDVVIAGAEQAAYAAEGIPWDTIAARDGHPTLDAIEGAFLLLDDECVIPKGSIENFFDKFVKSQASSPAIRDDSRRRPLHLTVIHYAGDVQYDLSEFLNKNRDRISDDLHQLMETSTGDVVSKMLSAMLPFTTSTEIITDEQSSSSTTRSTSHRRRRPQRRFHAGQFRGQVSHLVSILSMTSPSFIRCIRPNHSQLPDVFDSSDVISQLGNAGVLELVRVRQAGYPVRIGIEQARSRYMVVGDGFGLPAGSFAIGKTMVFLKSDAYATLEARRAAIFTTPTTTLQALWRALDGVRRHGCKRYSMQIIQAGVAAFAREKSGRRLQVLLASMTMLATRQRMLATLRQMLATRPRRESLKLGAIDGVDVGGAVTDRVTLLLWVGGGDIRAALGRVVAAVREQDGRPFRVFNLCSEAVCDEGDESWLESFPVIGHAPCMFTTLVAFNDHLDSWLASDDDAVGIIISKTGKGRASMMVSAYLLKCGVATSVAEALSGAHRLDHDQNLAPSQLRYLDYYALWLRSSGGHPDLEAAAELTEAYLDNFDASSIGATMEIWLMIASEQVSGKIRQKWIRMASRSATSCMWHLRKPCLLNGDVKIEVLSREKKGKLAKVLMYVCLNGAFVNDRNIFAKKDLDKAYRDANDVRFPSTLELTLVCNGARRR